MRPYIEMIPRLHLEVLCKVRTRLEGCPAPWAVTGSLGMALQGVPVEVHDIDIQTDREGAYEIERRLAEFVVRPVCFSEAERIRSHLGRLEIDDLQVEIMGDLQKRLEDGRWEEPVPIEPHRRWVEVEGVQVPVLSLEYELQAYLKLGRSDRAEMLRAWLSGRS
ncbi:MAG: nucleotidyltransferase domain-containing protein [Chloroflexia bacterium]